MVRTQEQLGRTSASVGEYKAAVWVSGDESEEIEFEVPEGGSESLELVFARRGGG